MGPIFGADLEATEGMFAVWSNLELAYRIRPSNEITLGATACWVGVVRSNHRAAFSDSRERVLD